MTEPIISSDKELSLASAQEIKNSNILDGIGDHRILIDPA